jgi:uncharacterized protein with PIN domain
MRFLFDQSTDRRLAPYLRQAGHDVTVIAADYPPSLPDDAVLTIAQREQRVLITEDRDFGELVFRHRHAHSGVIYWRLPPMELAAKIARLSGLLDEHAADLDQFLVVTERGVRVRRSRPP